MFSILLVLFAGSAALADTLYLKNGRERRGTFIGYENGEFIFEIARGNRIQVKAGQVSRLVLDQDRTARGPRDEDRRRDSSFSDSSRRGQWESSEAFDVRLEERWVRSPVRVSNGERVRVEASGTVTLDGRTMVTADGFQGQRDRSAPMPGENAGALIATIGQAFNSPAILVGRSREFAADRDGVLYFTINHSITADSRGAFRVNVSVNRDTGDRDDDWTDRSTGTTQGREKTVLVYANQAWTDTGIDLEPDMSLEFVAEGQIEFGVGRSTGPNGNRSANLSSSGYPVQNAGVGAVIAKIRYRDGSDSNVIFIGSGTKANTGRNEYGRLLIGVNDDNYRDNNGSYRVTIRW